MNKPYICFFGTYDRSFTSNRLILNGLKSVGAKVLEVNAEVRITKLDTKSEMGWLQIFRRIWVKHRIINEVIKQWKNISETDVIYVGYPGHFDVLLAWPIAKILKKKLVFNPLVIFYTGFTEEQGILKKNSVMGILSKWGEGFMYNLCDIVFADTPLQKDFLINVLGVKKDKIKVLPIGADATYYRFTPYTNTTQKINVIYYGLYSPIHGVEYIIDAANKLRNNKNIKFTFVGNGNTFDKNYKRAQKLNLKNCTFFYNTPLDEHPDIIVKGDIFLGFLQKHPSVDRIIPNKIYQGLALNKVVLTADAPVTRSLFTHKKDIYLIPQASSKSLVDALLELSANPSLRKLIAENGYALYKKRFTPEKVVSQLIKYVQ